MIRAWFTSAVPDGLPAAALPVRAKLGLAGYAAIAIVVGACGQPHAVPAVASSQTHAPCVPLRAVALQDKSRSGLVNRTPQLDTAQLAGVVRYVATCGGEIGLGLINRRSNAPLVRLYVSEPPLAVTEPELIGTGFDRRDTRRAYQHALDVYNAERSVWEHQTESAVRQFTTEAHQILGLPADAPATDVWSAVGRARQFALEPGYWHAAYRTVALIISDGQDNARAQPVSLPANLELLVVNGNPVAETLDRLNPMKFEAIDPAIRYMLRMNGHAQR